MIISAAEYMQEIRATNISIHNMKRSLKVLDDMLEAKAITYNPDRVTTSPRQDGLEQLAIKHLEEQARIQQEMQEQITWMFNRMNEATNYINEIESEDQKEVLMLRYIECRSWSDILDIRECDDISAQYRLHKRALESLQKVIDDHSMTTI